MALTRNDFEGILKKYAHNSSLKLVRMSRLGISQMVRALMTYARGASSKDIVAIYDPSLLKNGKSGYLLAVHGLYSSEFVGRPILFDEIQSVAHQSGKMTVTALDGKKEVYLLGSRENAVFELIREVMVLKGVDVSKQPTTAKKEPSKKAPKPDAKPEAAAPAPKSAPVKSSGKSVKKSAPQDLLHAEIASAQNEANLTLQKTMKETKSKPSEPKKTPKIETDMPKSKPAPDPIVRREAFISYDDGEQHHFIDANNFEEYAVAHSAVPENYKFCKEDDRITVLLCNGQVSGIELPAFVELEVIRTEHRLSGDSPTNAMKPAVVETGAEIFVPMYIGEGDRIRIDLATGEYQSR